MLHLITDTTVQNRYSHAELAELAFAGGATYVQYRNKAFDRSRDLEDLMKIALVAKRLGRILIVNDDAALALEVGAQGVHLGIEDGSPAKARALLGPEAVIGATVHNHEELDALRGQNIDYIGVGPVYGTRSKDTGLPDLGLENLRSLCEASPFPVVGIGGITPENALPVYRAGGSGIAILSAFCKAPNPKKFVQDLLPILP